MSAPVATHSASPSLLHRLGFPSAGMVVGFIAVTIFLVVDGIEIVWITNFLRESRNMSLDQAGQAVAWYGIVVASAAFLASALSKSWGPKKVMLIGLIDFVVFDFLFITLGLTGDGWALLVFFYAMRGFAYPFFAYGFLTWVLSISPSENQGKMNGWFWFAYSTGTQIIGSALASSLLDVFHVDEVAILWVGLALTILGGAVGLWIMRHEPEPRSTMPLGTALGTSVSVMWRYPRVSLGVIVKIINLAAPFGLNVLLVTYLTSEFGMDKGAAINMFVVYGVFAVIGNVFWGYMGERLGWHFCTPWVAIPRLRRRPAVPVLRAPGRGEQLPRGLPRHGPARPDHLGLRAHGAADHRLRARRGGLRDGHAELRLGCRVLRGPAAGELPVRRVRLRRLLLSAGRPVRRRVRDRPLHDAAGQREDRGPHAAGPHPPVHRERRPPRRGAGRALVSEKYGIADAWPVMAEPFEQWVLEDRFPLGRPAFEEVGVQLVEDVVPYELMKLRLLNAGHQALAYAGFLRGHTAVHDAMHDAAVEAFLRRYWDEARPTLGPVPGIDLDAYVEELTVRFGNPEVADTLARLAFDASDRVPTFVLPAVRDNLEAGRDVTLGAALVAMWAQARAVKAEARYEMQDAMADELDRLAARQAGGEDLAFLQARTVFGDLADQEAFTGPYVEALRTLQTEGVDALLVRLG